VQSSPHVGHLRPSVAFDVLRRWLTRSGYTVTLIRNITDIDDKILSKAAVAKVEWWAHAAAYEREFTAAYDALGVMPPTFEPRATAHVTDMVALMDRLIERGHAYTTGPGNVWFDVRSYPAYGDLTRQRLDDLAPEPQSAMDAADPGHAKRSPHDFALWKANRVNEPATASWPTPWGPGRPGWHLECSAMAGRYLGESFDIHGGGLDLRFPHHENEQAQSRAAGYGFAQRWMHTAWITQSGAKMSKSLGNGLAVDELLAVAPPAVVRYAIAAVHYRSMLEWTTDTLTEAGAVWDRLVGFVQRASEFIGDDGSDDGSSDGTSSAGDVGGVDGADGSSDVSRSDLPEAFVAAMNDDLNTPAALAVIHEHMRAGNTALAAAADKPAVSQALKAVRAMLDVFGLDPLSPQWSAGTAGASSASHEALNSLVTTALEDRAAARAAKDWAASDAIRDRLTAAGITIEDTPTGARWTLSSPAA
jgi:cysteinyl-tRNA synthetase